MSVFDQSYYDEHQTDRDRLALWYYARVIRARRPRGGRLLDFGSGTGHLLKRLRRFEALAYDPSPYARRRLAENAPGAAVVEDWQTIPEGSLDVVVALHSLEHLPQPEATLDGLARRLAPGGLLLAVVPNPDGWGHRLKGRAWFAYRDPTHCSLLRRDEWLDLVRGCGLCLESVRGDGMWDAPYVSFLPVPVQRLLFGVPAGLQVLSPLARPFLPPAWGECLILQARKP